MTEDEIDRAIRGIQKAAPALASAARSRQMSFDEVVEMELQPGDPEYTAWLAAGRPKLEEPDTPRERPLAVD